MTPTYYDFKFETKLVDTTKFVKVITYLELDRDDDCVKNWWTVIGETIDDKQVKLTNIENKLPIYTGNYALQELVDDVILNEINS